MMKRPAILNVRGASAVNMSRKDLIQWVNNQLQSEYTKIEQLHTGDGYAQLTNILFPDSVQMGRVKWNSSKESDWLSNWKLVQASWNNVGIAKTIPVDRLIKGKFQDNFEFLQWFQKFFNANYDNRENDPRLACESVQPSGSGAYGNKALSTPASLRSADINKTFSVPHSIDKIPWKERKFGRIPSHRMSMVADSSTPVARAVSTRRTMVPMQPKAIPVKSVVRTPKVSQRVLSASNTVNKQDHDALVERFKMKNRQLREADDVLLRIEQERDFYFNKLRKLEIICQDCEDNAKEIIEVRQIFEVLYEKEDEPAEGEVALKLVAAPKESSVLSEGAEMSKIVSHSADESEV